MDMYSVSNIEVGCQAAIAGKPAPTEIGYGRNIEVGCQAAIAGKPAPTEIGYGRNIEVGCQAASLLIWLLIFLPPREAERRFCAVGNPAWMPG
jgi:hypothetical protein